MNSASKGSSFHSKYSRTILNEIDIQIGKLYERFKYRLKSLRILSIVMNTEWYSFDIFKHGVSTVSHMWI